MVWIFLYFIAGIVCYVWMVASVRGESCVTYGHLTYWFFLHLLLWPLMCLLYIGVLLEEGVWSKSVWGDDD